MSWDGEMDDFYADGYAAEREAARTAKFRVTFDIEYDPETITPIAEWQLNSMLWSLIDETENIAINNVKVEER